MRSCSVGASAEPQRREGQASPASGAPSGDLLPRHGPDEAVAVAGRLHAIGHAVTVRVVARMVRDRTHPDALLTTMVQAGADDLFLIGGDADPPLGEYASAVELLPLVAEHQRRRGTTLPVMIGIPGKVARRRLLEMSVRIGVGPTLAFVRKQRGVRSLLTRRSTAGRLYQALAPALDDSALNVPGFHYFTFNQLVEMWEWYCTHESECRRQSPEPVSAGVYIHREEGATS